MTKLGLRASAMALPSMVLALGARDVFGATLSAEKRDMGKNVKMEGMKEVEGVKAGLGARNAEEGAEGGRPGGAMRPGQALGSGFFKTFGSTHRLEMRKKEQKRKAKRRLLAMRP